MIRLVIFDFDGTIADSFEVSLQIATELLGRPRPSTDEIETLRSLPTKAVMKRLGIRSWQLPKLLSKGRKLMAQKTPEVALFAGLESAFKQFKASEVQMCIMSSNDKQVIEVFLRQHGCQDYFTNIIGGVNLFKKAKQLQRIQSIFGVKLDEMIYVGDETRDIDAAKKVGIRSAAVTWGYNSEAALSERNPDIIIKKTMSLKEGITTIV